MRLIRLYLMILNANNTILLAARMMALEELALEVADLKVFLVLGGRVLILVKALAADFQNLILKALLLKIFFQVYLEETAHAVAQNNKQKDKIYKLTLI